MRGISIFTREPLVFVGATYETMIAMVGVGVRGGKVAFMDSI